MLSSRRWHAAMIGLVLSAHVHAQQTERYTDAAKQLIAAINADDQAAIQQMFSAEMQNFLPAEKAGPFFHGVVSAKGKLRAPGAPEVSGPTAKVRVTAERGDWQFEITLDASDKIAGLRIVPASGEPGRTEARQGAAGPERKYVELSRSPNREIRSWAERYLNLVKFREWRTASGKSVTAKYVGHDPDQSRVKLAVYRGTGKDRVLQEFDVELTKLDKSARDVLRQIVATQRKIDELVAAAGAQGTPGGPGQPMLDERGANPGDVHVGQGPEGPYEGPGAAPPPHALPPSGPQANAPDPSESEPDPLGFANLPPVAAIVPAAAGGEPMNRLAGEFVAPGTASTAPKADRTKWRTDLTAFAANLSIGTDPTGNPMVDWGAMKELGEMNELAVARRTQGAPPPSGEAATPAAISERLGDVHWQVVVDKIEDAPGGMIDVQFRPVELPSPIELQIKLDEAEDARKWTQVAAGTPVKVTGRLIIDEPYKIMAKVRLADAK